MNGLLRIKADIESEIVSSQRGILGRATLISRLPLGEWLEYNLEELRLDIAEAICNIENHNRITSYIDERVAREACGES